MKLERSNRIVKKKKKKTTGIKCRILCDDWRHRVKFFVCLFPKLFHKLFPSYSFVICIRKRVHRARSWLAAVFTTITYYSSPFVKRDLKFIMLPRLGAQLLLFRVQHSRSRSHTRPLNYFYPRSWQRDEEKKILQFPFIVAHTHTQISLWFTPRTKGRSGQVRCTRTSRNCYTSLGAFFSAEKRGLPHTTQRDTHCVRSRQTQTPISKKPTVW